MAGVKGPRPCLGLLGKGDWPLSTRAYSRTETLNLLTYTCWHTCNRPSTIHQLGRHGSSLFLSYPSFLLFFSLTLLVHLEPPFSILAASDALSLPDYESAPLCTSVADQLLFLGSIFLAPGLLFTTSSTISSKNSRRRINLESENEITPLLGFFFFCTRRFLLLEEMISS